MSGYTQKQIAFQAQGHPNIRATHRSTLEITTASELTLRGNCIIGVCATLSPKTIDLELGTLLRQPGSRIITRLTLDNLCEEIHGLGAPELTLLDKQSLVWRTSSYVDDRTVAIRCDKAAKDISRQIIQYLQNPNSIIQVVISVSSGSTTISRTT